MKKIFSDNLNLAQPTSNEAQSLAMGKDINMPETTNFTKHSRPTRQRKRKRRRSLPADNG